MKKESVFLGTGAGEMFPNPFCNCAMCQQARESKDTRLRSAFLVDETMMIDFGPDVCAASQHYDAPLYNVERVLVTHTHEDHFDSSAFSILTMTTLQKCVHFYFAKEALDWVNKRVDLEKDLVGTFGYILNYLQSSGRICFHEVEPYHTYDFGDKTVIPVKTNHPGYGEGEFGLNYLICWEKGNWLYASDTGRYPEENIEFLKEYVQEHGVLDTIIIEGTYGDIDSYDGKSHMSARLLVGELRRYRDSGLINDDTKVYITHINQVQTFSPAEFQEYMDENGNAKVIIAHDGMRL